MDGTRTRRSQPLAVLQEFAGGRLEKQVLSRAYELAAPPLRMLMGKIRVSSPAQPLGQAESIKQTLSKGA